MAFQTALRSWLVAQDASPAQDSVSWSAVVAPKNKEEPASSVGTLRDLVAEHDPRLYVSATTPSQVSTISGPPSALAGLLAKIKASGKLHARCLDIQSPFHSGSYFGESDIEEILDGMSEDIVTRPVTNPIPVLASSTGKPVLASTFWGLLYVVVREALLEPVRWEVVASQIQRNLESLGRNDQSSSQPIQVTIVPFSSHAASMLSTGLTSNPKIRITVTIDDSPQHLPPPPSLGSSAGTPFVDSRIAIIGYSGRFPSAASDAAFWSLLRAGRDVHREIPADRFDWQAHYDPTGKRKNTSRVKYGCFIDEPGVFDARFFNMSPREAENTDPAQRLAITTTYEAMEMAGLVRNRTPSTQQDRIGVFFGVTSDDWREVNSGQDVDTYFIPGGNRAFVPGRIRYVCTK